MVRDCTPASGVRTRSRRAEHFCDHRALHEEVAVRRKRGELVVMLWGPGFRSNSKQLNFTWAQEDLHASMQHSTISFRLVRRTP